MKANYFDWDHGEPNDAGNNNTPEEKVGISHSSYQIVIIIIAIVKVVNNDTPEEKVGRLS